MTDTMSDFLDFGDDQNDQFADEYTNLNQCGGSPSSEDAELNALDNSVSALSTTSQNEVDMEMSDFALAASLGSSWTGVSDSFSQMHVKTETTEPEMSVFEDAVTIPGSWPSASAMRSTGMRTPATTAHSDQSLQPSSFTLAQIAPPSLPQERSNSTTASSLCSESIKEEEELNCHQSDLLEPAKKRRASESARKTSISYKPSGHKRTTSNTISSMRPTAPPAATARPVGVELDESGDPITAKRQDRLMRNRAAALASRERKREHVTRLEQSVVELETGKNRLKVQVTRMNEEIMRLRKLLSDNDIEDPEKATFDIEEIQEEVDESPQDCDETASTKPEHAAITRTRAAPTGFSPRGALKKTEIIANHLRAEEHLRNVTMKQAGLTSSAASSTTGDDVAEASPELHLHSVHERCEARTNDVKGDDLSRLNFNELTTTTLGQAV